MAYRRKFKPTVTQEGWDKMQSKNPLWTKEVYNQTEDLAGLFSDNVNYLLEKKGMRKSDLVKWLGEMRLNIRLARINEWKKSYAIYPSLVEIVYFAKFFEVNPGQMISKDFKESDRLKGISKKNV